MVCVELEISRIFGVIRTQIDVEKVVYLTDVLIWMASVVKLPLQIQILDLLDYSVVCLTMCS